MRRGHDSGGDTEGPSRAFGAIVAPGKPGPACFHLPDGAELRILLRQLGHRADNVLDHVPVTQDAIYILDSHKLSGGAKPTSIAGTLPRRTQLGPVSGRWGQMTLLGERHWVKRRFQTEVTSADAEAGFTYGPR
jgi:hypothetical protein